MIDVDAIRASAVPVAGFLDGFRAARLTLDDGAVFYRIGGSGPPLVLLHGYPQTGAMWHRVAGRLAQDYTVVIPDLRGYGRSGKPLTDAGHTPYAKRAMASDVLALMDALGFARFLVGSHDRGARVAHRLAADHPERVRALATLDIAPTREMYAVGGPAFAADYWHWYWLIQPAPLPERMIGADAAWFWCRKCCFGCAGAGPFAAQALKEYLDCFTPEVIHASCEDYRAAWSIDLVHDDAETAPMEVPVLALWGDKGAIARHFDCLALWRSRALTVSGHALPGGHYLAEECPDDVLAAWLPFFAQARP